MNSSGSANLKIKQFFPFINQSGLNLIEIMVVMVIVGAMIAVIAPRLGGSQNEAKAFLRNFGALTRQVQNQARLQNRTFRLAIQFMDDDGKKSTELWAESGPSGSLLKTQEQREKELDRLKSQKEPPKSDFVPDGTIMKAKKILKGNLLIKSVEYKNNETISSGAAYIYFFPQGMAQESAIQLINAKNVVTYTLYIQPLTGETNIFSGEKTMAELAP